MEYKKFLIPVSIEADFLDEAWFLALQSMFIDGRVYQIDQGSFEGHRRLELDFVTINIKHPGEGNLIPVIPEGMARVTAPASPEHVNSYYSYLMSADKAEYEQYTYGERIVGGVNQVEKIIERFRKYGEGTNQCCMAVARPEDIELTDPPCLRMIDCRMMYGQLHFIVYFRSWDLWGGLPSNLAGIQTLKAIMADSIGCGDGEIIACSKGLHLYDMAWEQAAIRTYKIEQYNHLMKFLG